MWQPTREPLTVTELNAYTRRLLAGDPLLRGLDVTGEITGYKLHAPSGHHYFTLKDENSRVPCAMYRQHAMTGLDFKPEDGMRVTVRCSASLYERDGKFQLYVNSMHKAGQGDLFIQFEKLKRKLMAEGLFDPARKREIPSMPRTIGIATSISGKGKDDIIRVARQRNPGIGIILSPCAVQGEGAAEEIARAIERLNANGESDVILVGRGGGAMEEMWAFNEEVVARAIAASRIPVISCVGHETDFTIADFVADLRAPTPTGAAVLAVPEVSALKQELNHMLKRVANALEGGQRVRRLQLDRLSASPAMTRPLQHLIEPRRALLERLSQRLGAAVPAITQTRRHRLDELTASLRAMNPASVLERGYAIVRQGDAIIPRADAVDATKPVFVRFSDGEITAVITENKQGND